METKNHDEALFKNSDLTNHFTVPLIGLAGGLSLSWRDDLQVIFYTRLRILSIHELRRTGHLVSYLSFTVLRTPLTVLLSGTNWRNYEHRERKLGFLLEISMIWTTRRKWGGGGPLGWEGSFLSFRSFVF